MHLTRTGVRPARRSHLSLLALVGALAVQGCGDDKEEARPTAARVTVAAEATATWLYPLRADKAVTRGAVTFTVDNPSATERGAQLVRVDAGHDAAEAFTALSKVGEGAAMPGWLEWAGGVGVTRPGQTYVFTVDLRPGLYYVLDRSFQGKAAGTAAADEGAALTVVASDRPTPLPSTSGTVTAGSAGLSTKGLATGRATLLLANNGKQPHNVVLSPLLPGKTLDDVRAYAASEDDSVPPPVDLQREVVSGTLAPGMRQTLTVDLRAGSYALLCFASDTAGGPPHAFAGETSLVEVP